MKIWHIHLAYLRLKPCSFKENKAQFATEVALVLTCTHHLQYTSEIVFTYLQKFQRTSTEDLTLCSIYLNVQHLKLVEEALMTCKTIFRAIKFQVQPGD